MLNDKKYIAISGDYANKLLLLLEYWIFFRAPDGATQPRTNTFLKYLVDSLLIKTLTPPGATCKQYKLVINFKFHWPRTSYRFHQESTYNFPVHVQSTYLLTLFRSDTLLIRIIIIRSFLIATWFCSILHKFPESRIGVVIYFRGP